MLTDHWIIAQLVAQTCSVALLLGALRYSVTIVRAWQPENNTTLQLTLERKAYLVSSVVGIAVVFQLLSLIMFVVTVNEHLPSLIKGAMCATGTLSLNPWGYPLLFLKVAGVLVYLFYLALHYFDEQEPGFPLTPQKYWWVFPSVAVAVADLVMMFFYFGSISPDIIATCCSVSFNLVNTRAEQALSISQLSGVWFWGFWAASFLLSLSFWAFRKRPILTFLMGGLFVAFAVLSLKTFFVKYIYGLPSHLCLFDLFLAQHHYVGYLIFGGYYLLLGGLLFLSLLQAAAPRLSADHKAIRKRLWLAVYLGALIAWAVPVMYWWAWSGTL